MEGQTRAALDPELWEREEDQAPGEVWPVGASPLTLLGAAAVAGEREKWGGGSANSAFGGFAVKGAVLVAGQERGVLS